MILMKKIKWVIVVVMVIIIVVPSVLNYVLLQPAICDVIQPNTASSIWLSFWSGCIGSVLTACVSYYILYVNRKDECNRLEYQFAKDNLEKSIQYSIMYLKIYNENELKQIYNYWRLTNDGQVCKERIKELLDNAFISFETFTLMYSKERLINDKFFTGQFENYVNMVSLLQDLQILFSENSSLWNNPSEFINAINRQRSDIEDIISPLFLELLKSLKGKEPIFQKLLEIEKYKNLNLKTVESQIRKFIDQEREKVNTKLQKTYE